MLGQCNGRARPFIAQKTYAKFEGDAFVSCEMRRYLFPVWVGSGLRHRQSAHAIDSAPDFTFTASAVLSGTKRIEPLILCLIRAANWVFIL
jgi:hypothetical protein